MWFEPLAEVGTLLVGCAAMLGAAVPLLKKPVPFLNKGIDTNTRSGGRK